MERYSESQTAARTGTVCAYLHRSTIGESYCKYGHLISRLAANRRDRLGEFWRHGHRTIVKSFAGNSRGDEIEELLHMLQVPYSELAFELKTTVGATVSTGNDLSVTQQTGRQVPKIERIEDSACFGFIAARSFNKVEIVDDSVIVKSSSAPSIRGELFFYVHMPHDISHFFPNLLRGWSGESGLVDSPWRTSRSSSDMKSEEDTSLPEHCEIVQYKKDNGPVSIYLSRVCGPTLSHLLTSRCLTPDLLKTVLRALYEIHCSNGFRLSCVCSSNDVDIYSNYSRKVKTRLDQNVSAFNGMKHVLNDGHLSRMLSLLSSYENEKRGIAARVVHGDPVLSNVISLRNGRVKFIDMRGMQGDDVLTLAGDVVYDLAKVFQSLCGYDYIIQDCKIQNRDSLIMAEFRQTFQSQVATMYPTVKFRDIILVTSSLYASLIPLHDSQIHRLKFAELAVNLLDLAEKTMDEGGNEVLGEVLLPRLIR